MQIIDECAEFMINGSCIGVGPMSHTNKNVCFFTLELFDHEFNLKMLSHVKFQLRYQFEHFFKFLSDFHHICSDTCESKSKFIRKVFGESPLMPLIPDIFELRFTFCINLQQLHACGFLSLGCIVCLV